MLSHFLTNFEPLFSSLVIHKLQQKTILEQQLLLSTGVLVDKLGILLVHEQTNTQIVVEFVLEEIGVIQFVEVDFDFAFADVDAELADELHPGFGREGVEVDFFGSFGPQTQLRQDEQEDEPHFLLYIS